MFDIHCPVCGELIKKEDIQFSIGDLAERALKKAMEFNNGVAGNFIDVDNAFCFTNKNASLWMFTKGEIEDVCNKHNGWFTIDEETILDRFIGDENRNKLYECREFFQDEAYDDSNKQLVDIINFAREKFPDAVAVKNVLDNDTIYSLIKYALDSRGDESADPLFRTKLELRNTECDDGDMLLASITTAGEQASTMKKICPNCYHELSRMAGKYEEKIVCFMGSPTAGKTAYLTSMIHYLEDNGSDIGVSVSLSDLGEGNEDSQYFEKYCLEPFKYGFAPIKTDADKFPHISVLFKDEKTNKKTLYTFVDMPGEIFAQENDGDVMQMDAASILSNRKIITKADVIWFCIASEQMFEVDSQILNDDDSRRAMDTGNKQIDTRATIELYHLGTKVKGIMDLMFERKEDIPPVAIIITKSDQLTGFIEEKKDGKEDKDVFADYYKNICIDPDKTGLNVGSFTELMKGSKGYSYETFRSKAEVVNQFANEFAVSSYKNFKVFAKDAFGLEDATYLIMFSTASMGRRAVNYSKEQMVKILLNNESTKEKILKYLPDGDSYNMDMTTERAMKKLYKETFPMYSFGLDGPILWTLAYTNFFNVAKLGSDGEYHTIDINEDNLEAIHRNLKMQYADIQMKKIVNNSAASFEPKSKQSQNVNSKEKKGGFFSSLFGRKR